MTLNLNYKNCTDFKPPLNFSEFKTFQIKKNTSYCLDFQKDFNLILHYNNLINK